MVDEKGTTEHATGGAERPTPPSRLMRAHEGRILAGVCTGLGRYTGIDPVVIRVGFAVLALANGQGIFLYIAAALLMPPEPDKSSVAEQLFRRRFDAPGAMTFLGALLAGLVALSVLGNGVLSLLGDRASTDAFAVLTVVVLIMMVAHGRGIDLVGAARSLPEKLQGYPPGTEGEGEIGTRDERTRIGVAVSLQKDRASGDWLSEGMVDLATLGTSTTSGAADATAAPAKPFPPTRGGTYPGKPRHRRSPLTSITLLAALVAVAAFWPSAQSRPGPEGTMILMAAALAVLGCGLVAGGWFRARGLATAGTVLTCALLTTSVAAEAPQDARYGEIEWRPVDAASVQPDYRIAAGSGRLDLTALPLRPGQRVTVNAQVTLGELQVRLPPQARVEVDARVGLGDLQVDGRTISGPGARTRQVLEPETPGVRNPPVIDLRIRARFSDVDVRVLRD